jgi:hypothetical protein
MASSQQPGPAFADIDWKQQEADDAAEAARIFDQINNTGDLILPAGEVGEKADDAIDYDDVDFDDDELPDEEEPSGPSLDTVPGLTEDEGTSHEVDDLFGEDDYPEVVNGGLTFPSADPEPYDIEAQRRFNFPDHYNTNQDPDIPEVAETSEELVKQMWPAFKPHEVLNFLELFPPKPAHYVPKEPEKPPKALFPTKVSLEIAPDQEKAFRSNTVTYSNKNKRALEAESRGIIRIEEEESAEEESGDDRDYELPDPYEKIGGVTWRDLEFICSDWTSVMNPPQESQDEEEEEPLDEWEMDILGHSAKRRKTKHPEPDYTNVPRFQVPSLDNFVEQTAKIAKRVILDENDPYLLLDVQHSSAPKRQKLVGGRFKRAGKGGVSSSLSSRFNISNDEAYDALKENHQKVRATLNEVALEHSMPALKLQWPYYRVKLGLHDARAYHRPSLKFHKFVGRPILFSKPGATKKKNVKGLHVNEIFKDTKSLSLADHYSTATLLEYSEEHPTVLSNFGMANRIINYYRRKDAADQYRPVPEDKVGEPNILLPEDKSPFANFGPVDPGETVRTVTNQMYRAPIFKHTPRETDFLVIRNTTGVDGTDWHIRNIDNLFVVGQQLPSVEIPNEHSRRVTNAAKNRMKMISYRKIRHSERNEMKIAEITQHITDSQDTTNRQKLKEFLTYDKVNKVWRMRPGESVPEEAQTRIMVPPEEVCCLDAMQVGVQYLADSGYAAEDKEKYDEDREQDEDNLTLDQKLAPWKTTKAFLDATKEKAMLELHGEGDPSAAGLAFSMIKTSMKGGYIGALQGPDATSASAINESKKANGGHTYNVKKQQALYEEAIRNIWEKQKANLSNGTDYTEDDLEIEQAEEDARLGGVAQTPHSAATPAAFDDSASQFSAGDQRSGRAMRITRTYMTKHGPEERTEVIQDIRVWREYQKRRYALDAEKLKYESNNQTYAGVNLASSVYEAKPTGNPELDRQEAIRYVSNRRVLCSVNESSIRNELARLEKNKERRHHREKLKQGGSRPTIDPEDAGSPSATPAPSIEKPTGTTRKCANCGQMGHIKTNKKYCSDCDSNFH